MPHCPQTLDECRAWDAQDPLRLLRDAFDLPPGLIYLDGNSLGALPRSAPQRIQQVVQQEWGQQLIRAWNSAGWFDLPRRLGERIAALIGAGPGQVVVTDTTSINLYKVLAMALALQTAPGQPRRTRVVSERDNFPTDLYIAQSLCAQHGCELVLLDDAEAMAASLGADVAVLLLTHVNYRTGALHDMAALTAQAHTHGVLTVWDLAHSAGAVPLDLLGAQADFAVGCGYKYLNGGPGAPAFAWVHPRHASTRPQPLTGWWGHARPFAFSPQYDPAAGTAQLLCGTQPIISLAGLECGLAVFEQAQALGGMAALRQKSLALTDTFIHLVAQRCAAWDLRVVTPLAHERRGSQVSLAPPEGAYAIVQALIERGVVGDFRGGADGQPDLMRFGFAPLYLGFEDVWWAVEHLQHVLDSSLWRQPRFQQRRAVT